MLFLADSDSCVVFFSERMVHGLKLNTTYISLTSRLTWNVSMVIKALISLFKTKLTSSGFLAFE